MTGLAATTRLQLVAFAALCTFASAHWAAAELHAPRGRVVAVVLAVTAGGAAMALVANAERLPRRASLALRALLAVSTLALALLAAGVPARLLLPGHWGALADGVDRGLTGTSTITWPYVGDDHWIRLTIFLAIPAVAAAAAALAFAPRAGRAREVGRTAALLLLVGLYTFGATELGLGKPVLRGLALLALIVAWLWLPRMRRRDAFPAAAAVLAAGVLAIPLARSLDAGQSWIQWKQWHWFTPTGGEGFSWNHSYGPMTWPRTGATVLDVKAARSHYWRAETLDDFDGFRWQHSDRFAATDLRGGLPPRLDRRWVESFHVSVRDLSSDVIVGPGTVLDYRGSHSVSTTADGTTTVLDDAVGKGESYDGLAYVPDPTAKQMRSAPASFPDDITPYVQLQLPGPAGSELPVQGSVWNLPGGSAHPADTARILASPYRRVYQLAHTLAAGKPTAYDVVRTTEDYLQSHYQYSEQPPRRAYPLAAFLFKDKIGYCQQFAGAMALMLRMDGIPARVAAGFAPGTYDAGAHEFRVTDLDAHSWVEAWFTGIGWVPFDPTPSTAPASLQAGGSQSTSAAQGGNRDHGSSPVSEGHSTPHSAGGIGQSGGGSSPLWIVVTVGIGLVALSIAALYGAAALRGRRLRVRHGEPALAELMAALQVLGYRVAPGTTLAQLERRMRTVADERAARYVHLLRDRRFRRGAPGPTPADRRALRAALSAGRGPLGRLRGLAALPPRSRRAF